MFRAKLMRLISSLALLVGLIGSESLKTVSAATFTVINTNNGGAGSLRQAIFDASAGDVITFDSSLSGSTIASSSISLTKDLVIDASNLSVPITLDGGGMFQLFQVASGVTVEFKKLILTHGGGVNLGGAINNQGTLKLTGSVISNNGASGFGGGIYNTGTLTSIDSTFSNNVADQGDGGAIWNQGTAVLQNNTFINNSANASCTQDCNGAIYNQGDLTVTNSTFYGNAPSAIHTYGKLTVTNSTLSNNGGFGITAAGNYSTGSNTSELRISNTILANNQKASNSGSMDCYNNGAMLLVNVGNLMESGNCGVPATSSDPNLSPLANNGGLTQTMALPSDSPAINAGDDASCSSTDQRGIGRPQGLHCDIGAFEYYDGVIAEGQTMRVSVDSNGGQGGGYEASISADGRYVAFTSAASNLVPNDTNGADDVFVRDTQSGITTRASLGSQPEDNGQLGCCSSYPSISADGRYVAFQYNGTIMVRDMQMGANIIVPGSSYHPVISANGRFIVFDSFATDLVPNDTNENADIFIRDLTMGTTTRVSVDSNGGQANGNSTIPFVSTDGRYVVFQSDATNLVPGDTNAQSDVFIHDMQTGITTRASVDGNGGQANSDSSYASVSADGRYIAFQSNAANLSVGDTNTQSDIFVHDMQTGNTSRISTDSNGVQGNGSSNNSSVSADGRYIVFESNATNLIQNDTNGVTDTFVHDMRTGLTTRVSVDSNGAQGIVNPPCFPCYTFKLSVSEDGSYMAFTSYASNLVPDDTNSKMDVFVHRQNISAIPPVATSTPVSTLTNTQMPTATGIPTYTPTLNLTPTKTPTSIPTSTSTNTPTTTSTSTLTPTPVLHVISGNVGVGGASLSYVENGISKTVISSGNGNYLINVPEHWSGTIVPYKSSYVFTPSSRTYQDMLADQYSENYTAKIIVTTITDSGPGSLRQAIADAPLGSTIYFDPALAGQTILLSSQLVINKDLLIDGSDLTSRISISGNNVVRIFNIGSNCTITLKSLILKDGFMSGTSYTAYGGAIFVNSSNLTITNVTFIGNRAYKAGAIYISPYAVVTILNSEITGNKADQEAGAIFVQSIGILNLRSSVVSNNTAGAAGTIYFTGATNSSLIENNLFADNSALAGGAITGQLGNARIEIRNNLFTGNHATSAYQAGGAVYFSASTIPTLVILENNTFYNNVAAGIGGAAYLAAAADFYLTNNTFSNNMASTGGNLYLDAGVSVSKMYNNILANAVGGGDCYAYYNSYISGSNNLIEDGSPSCKPATTGDPMLGALTDNGGLTQTMALLPGSPAIDAGDDNNCTVADQRGVARPQGSHCDLGAYEYVFPPTPTPTNTATFTPTFTPTATPTFTPTYTPTNTFTPTVTPPYSYNPLYASFGSSGTLSGVSFANEDILSFDGSAWSMYMDGSDVGLGGADVEAFSIVDANTILMAFDKTITLSGISFAPTDIAKFSATSLGTNTAGTFSMYFHGSNVGFDTTSENIDAVDVLPDGRILLSTTGNVSVPNVSGVDEDILAFTPTSLGSTTSGTWTMYFDGSDVGLADASSEDTDVVDVGPDGKIYLSTLGSFTVNGITGAGEDVFICTPGSLGNTTACSYSPALYFDGSTWGLAGNNLDGFNLWTNGVVPSATPISTLTPTSTLAFTATPTKTITSTVTSTPPSPTVTFTRTATFTATSTKVASPTNTYTATVTILPSNTPVATSTYTATLGPSATSTFTATSTATATITNTPTLTATVTSTSTPTATFTSSPTFTVTPTSSVSDMIYANGFESGSFSGWSSSVTNGSNLSVSSNAALVGNYGMQVSINSTTAMYARDDSPLAEAHYRARFYFNPNSISMSTSDYTYPLEGRDSANNIVLRVQFKRSSAGYQLAARAYDSVLANWVSTPLVTISNSTHVVEVDWGNDGHLNFWVDGVQQGSLTGINNASYNIDSVRLGATYITSTVSGSYFIDAFESRRQTYIGP